MPGRGGSADGSFEGTINTALAEANHGDFAAADTLLAGYAARNPGTPEALETVYWRALFKLDPSNRGASVTQAIASLDGYLADNRPRQHVVEAATLRRTAAQIDALNKLAANASAQARDAANARTVAADAKADAKAVDATASATVDAKDAEIKRLKDDLAKANAELERIRKRLGQPPRP